MGNLVLTRIDSRLIHGQVMTKWVNQVQANKIIVVSDELANDEFMRSIYLMSHRLSRSTRRTFLATATYCCCFRALLH